MTLEKTLGEKVNAGPNVLRVLLRLERMHKLLVDVSCGAPMGFRN